MHFLTELRRRNVHSAALAYLTAAWLLVQVAATALPAFGWGAAAVRLTVLAAAVGFVPMLVIAWVYDFTPSGLKRTEDLDPAASITPHAGRALDRMIMLALALGLGMFAFKALVFDPQRDAAVAEQHAAEMAEAEAEANEKYAGLAATHDEIVAEMKRKAAIVKQNSIAVLAFDDLSPGGDHEWFSDGVAGEILSLFAHIPELFAISRQSSFFFKGKDVPISEIARQLNVAHILDGSVRKAGDDIRISVQLIRSADGVEIWSHTYNRTMANIFSVQDDVAAKVVEALKLHLLDPVPETRKTSPELYALVLQARHILGQGNNERWTEAIALYERVLEEDPDYVPAMTGLATVHNNQTADGLLPPDEGYVLARAWAERALALDPEHADAYSSLAWVTLNHERDLGRAASLYENALTLDPDNTPILGNAGALALGLARLTRAIQLMEHRTRQEPTRANAHKNLALVYNCAGRFNEAEASARAALRLSPSMWSASYELGRALLGQGDARAALTAMQDEASRPWRLIGMAIVQHALGDLAASNNALAELATTYEEEAPYNIAYVHAYRGEADEAFKWLDTAVESGDGGLSFIVTEPYFLTLHEDPRWEPFLASIGMNKATLDAIRFEVHLPEIPPRPFD